MELAQEDSRGLVLKAMETEMESFRKFDVQDEVDINDLTQHNHWRNDFCLHRNLTLL